MSDAIQRQYRAALDTIAEKYIPSNYPCAKKRAKAKNDQLKMINEIVQATKTFVAVAMGVKTTATGDVISDFEHPGYNP